MHLESVCGIYLIEDLVTGKVYVGQSVDCYSRLFKHREAMKRGDSNVGLNEIYRTRGFSSLRFEVVEECPEPVREARECFWMSRFNPEDLLNERVVPYNGQEGLVSEVMMVSDIVKHWSIQQEYQAREWKKYRDRVKSR